jgi:hypothetical protein
MKDLSHFCCQNKECSDYGRRGAGNLTVCMHYGRDKKLRLLYCRTCRARFSERKGTALFRSRLPGDKAETVLKHIQEGCGVRKTARLTGVDKGTVVRYSRLEGGHSENLHDDLVSFSPSDRRRAV